MKRNIALLLLGALVVGLLSACSGIASGASVNAASDPSTTPSHTLSVTGTGKVTVIPDIAYVTIGVHTEGKTVADTLQTNTAQAQKVADTLKALLSKYPPGVQDAGQPLLAILNVDAAAQAAHLDKLLAELQKESGAASDKAPLGKEGKNVTAEVKAGAVNTGKKPVAPFKTIPVKSPVTQEKKR